MRRLIDDPAMEDANEIEAGADAATRAFALACLRAERPYEVPPGRKQWVLARIRNARPSTARQPRRHGRLAFAAALVLLVVGGGVAVARSGVPGWAARVYHQLTGEAAESSPAPARAPARSARPVVGSRRPEAPPAAVAPSEAAVAAAVASAAVEPPPAAPIRPQRHRAITPAPSEDPGPVLLAMRALRREHDPARARRMAETYLREHPRAALAEEALAIVVEAAAAHHDPDAPALARRYLRQYPSGAFLNLARRVASAAD